MRRGFTAILILGLVAALVALVGTFYLEQNKKSVVQSTIPSPRSSSVDKTENWKTYTNKTYKFEFKYPPIFEYESENANMVSFSDTFVNQRVPDVSHLNFKRTIDSSTLKKCGETRIEGKYKCLTDPTKEETINGLKVVKIYLMEGEGDSMGQASYIVQLNDYPNVEFVQRELGGGHETGIDQILSTFKFTN